MLGRRHDEGSSATLGLIIGGAIFASAFVGAQVMVAQPGGIDRRPAALEVAAQHALEVVVGQAGTSGGGVAWTDNPDAIARFGLAREGEPNFLDYVKIKALRNGTMGIALNDAPDYPDVRLAMGITEGDFHLRTYPVLPGLDDPRWSKDPRGRFAYFAHYSGATSLGSMASWANASASALNVSLAIRNDGYQPAVYAANVGLGDPVANATFVTEQRHTRLLAPGEVQTVSVEFPRLQSWDDSFRGVKTDLSDAYGNVLVASSWISATPPEGGSAKIGVTLEASAMYYVSGEPVKFTGDHFDGGGAHLNADQSGRFVLVGPSGAEIVNTSVTLPRNKNAVYTYTCLNCTAVGNYTGTLWRGDMGVKARDVVHVSAAKMFDEKKTIDPIAVSEIGIIRSLVENFNGARFDSAEAPDGDVFGDDTNGPNELSSVLSRYTMVIVGSEVSQTSLNSATTKYAIADWVQAGGTLIVLGTQKQQSNWLEPIYHAAQINANGGISTPDPTHPVLSSPNRLDYRRYLDRARAWDIDADQPFTHILTRSQPNGNSMQDTLTIAAPGAFNEGTVVLTSYMPGALVSPQDDQEARRFLHNLMSQSYNMLFLDYGPPIPDGVPVGSAQRLVAVPHPNVPGAVVEVRLVMYVFG